MRLKFHFWQSANLLKCWPAFGMISRLHKFDELLMLRMGIFISDYCFAIAMLCWIQINFVDFVWIESEMQNAYFNGRKTNHKFEMVCKRIHDASHSFLPPTTIDWQRKPVHPIMSASPYLEYDKYELHLIEA